MDAHFNEYLAAVAGMAEIYGEPDFDGQAGAATGQPEAHAGELTAPAASPILG